MPLYEDSDVMQKKSIMRLFAIFLIICALVIYFPHDKDVYDVDVGSGSGDSGGGDDAAVGVDVGDANTRQAIVCLLMLMLMMVGPPLTII